MTQQAPGTVALVTGANRGIGFHVARQLARAGLTDPDWERAGVNALAYQSSKTTQNAATVMYAKELRETGIKVNAVDPCFRATDMTPGGAPASGAGDPAEGAAVATRMALIGDDGPTGEFHTDDGGTYPW